ncbi:MAG: GNAT family N-acetyltransferase [Mycoplasma sp.]
MFETKRLNIRKWKITDINNMYEAASDWRVASFTGFKVHESISETLKILNTFINDKEIYAIALNDDNEAIGSIGLHRRTYLDDVNGLVNYEIGYWLNPRYWGQGIMVEAISCIEEFAFNFKSADMIWITHADFNEKSKRVIEKCNYKPIGCRIGIGSDNRNPNHKYFMYGKSKKHEIDLNLYSMWRK